MCPETRAFSDPPARRLTRPRTEIEALRRLIRALVSGRGMFGQADIDALTDDGARLGAALIDARLRGIYKDDELRAGMLTVARRAG